MFCFIFLFKQKTAYDMRISDWSSDVCSSDLTAAPAQVTDRHQCPAAPAGGVSVAARPTTTDRTPAATPAAPNPACTNLPARSAAAGGCRFRVHAPPADGYARG